MEREDHLYAAFSYFDKDGSGYITQDELQQACDEFGIENVQLEEMIDEVDQDHVSMHESMIFLFLIDLPSIPFSFSIINMLEFSVRMGE